MSPRETGPEETQFQENNQEQKKEWIENEQSRIKMIRNTDSWLNKIAVMSIRTKTGNYSTPELLVLAQENG